METLLPELLDIVHSYESPYREICSQSADIKKKLKSMGISSSKNLYNTAFLELLIKEGKYNELLHDCLVAEDTELYTEIEKIILPFGIPIGWHEPDKNIKLNYENFKKILWKVIMDNCLYQSVSLLKKYNLRPADPSTVPIKMLRVFGENNPRRTDYLNAFIKRGYYEDAKDYLIMSTSAPLELGLMSNNDIILKLQTVNEESRKKRKLI